MIRDPLRDALCELVRKLQPAGIKLIVGGGYGLVLRAEYLRSTNAQTLRRDVPAIRGTEDIDCFLQSEIMTNAASTEAIRTALDELGYTPVVKHMHFTRQIDYNGVPVKTKIDFLAGPVPTPDQSKVQVRAMRMRPRLFDRLHAYVTPEAFFIEENVLAVDVSTDGSGLIVFLPHPYSYLVLKLIALRDRLQRSEGSDGKYHALDLYAIWSMITEPEWAESVQMRDRLLNHEVMSDARHALEVLFHARESVGAVALKDQAQRQGFEVTDEDIAAFAKDLRFLLVGE